MRALQVFSTRKLSPIFTSPNESEVPPVFVDRLGMKGWTSHCGGQDNKVEHSVMLQRINTCDENGGRREMEGFGTGALWKGAGLSPTVHNSYHSAHFNLTTGQTVTKGTKVSRGYYADNGPPTTLSNTGKDISLSYQHFSALDNVQFVNGNQLGRRLLCQVDQGLNVKLPLPGGHSFGLSGGLYNRVMATYTKFMQLPFLPKMKEDAVWIDRKVRLNPPSRHPAISAHAPHASQSPCSSLSHRPPP